MRSRAVRLTLTLLAVAALGAAAYFTWNIERQNVTASAIANDVEWRLVSAARQTLELRSAQHAYVAAGQSEQFWITKASDAMNQLRETLMTVRAMNLPGDVQAALERAVQALDELGRADRRARDYASNGQKLLASDLVFSDGLEGTQQILTALDDARTAQAAAAAAAQAASRKELAAVAGGGAAIALLVLVLLTSPGRAKEEPVATAGTVMLPRTLALSDSLDEITPKRAKEAVAAPSPAAAPAPVAPPAPQLQDVADVCTQLARVADTAALPSLLQRTALALDASGVVLWIMDPDGAELLPVASHGYSVAALSHMGPIARDAENVTAAAFRTGLLQTVTADTISNGAIAAPLVNTAGCVGVLSAEVRHDGEREPARLALATIVAAQLATLTAPPSRAENNRAAI